jgi:hypothetical protein
MGKLEVFIVFLGIVFIIAGYIETAWCVEKKKNRFNLLRGKLDVINLGSTYAHYAFRYTEEVKGFNAAFVPQYLYYDNVILHKLEPHLNKNCKVLIVLPDFVFAADGKRCVHEEYYEFLGRDEIHNWNWKTSMRRKIKIAKEPFTHEMRKQANKWNGYHATEEEKKTHALKRIADWEKNILNGKVTQPVITKTVEENIQENIKIVVEMVEYCWKMGYKPFLVTPPVSAEMNEKLGEECIDLFLKAPITRVCELLNNNVQVLNYQRDKEFQSLEMYLNSDCLNDEGSRLFTDRVLKDIGVSNGG